MASILLPWVENIGLRHQGVLMSSIRGCDIAPRHDPSKLAQRLLRAAILMPHAGRFANPLSYITIEPEEGRWFATMRAFSASWDHYPNHYVMHFLHACEIVGYKAPLEVPTFSRRFLMFYDEACNILHVNPEKQSQLDDRLNADEAKFAELQEAYHRSI